MPGQEDQEDYFNDLSQQLPTITIDDDESPSSSRTNADQPKAKRIACVLCRKRKLRCDGVRPACGTCNRLAHDCNYDEVRKKSGPKRGYVKLLEQRLQQVETLLKDNHEVPTATTTSAAQTQAQGQARTMPPMPSPPLSAPFGPLNANIMGHGIDVDSDGRHRAPRFGAAEQLRFQQQQQQQAQQQQVIPEPELNTMQDDLDLGFMDATPTLSLGDTMGSDPFGWDLIQLGFEEPLPAPDLVEQLHQIYFEKCHHIMPMLHRPRYLASMALPLNLQPPLSLRYSVWMSAAAASETLTSLIDIFYQRARKYLHQEEMKGHGEVIMSIQYTQAWTLIGLYEFKNMYFPRAWMSAGRACKSAQMLMLHRMDGAGLDVKQCLPPPKDWIEREERRRTFWACFCEDRYASIGTGWPMTLDERDIQTNLPASEKAYIMGTPEPTMTLEQALTPGTPFKNSPFSGVAMLAALFGRNLHHLHRAKPDDNEQNLSGPFWSRHHELDGILAHISLGLPGYMRMPAAIPDPNSIFVNMAIQTSVICLHQAAIFKADRYRLPASVSLDSRSRCVTAAAETARLMKMICHIDLVTMNPFLAFSLYVAARVFVQYLKFRSTDPQIRASLLFMMQAMHALKRTNALTESFIVQLEVDLESAGLDVGQRNLPSTAQMVSQLEKRSDPALGDQMKCSPLYELSDKQSAARSNPFMPKATQGRVSSVSSETDTQSPTAGDQKSGAFTSVASPSFSLPHHSKYTRAHYGDAVYGDATMTPPTDTMFPKRCGQNQTQTQTQSQTGSRQSSTTDGLSTHLTPPSDTSNSPAAGLNTIKPGFQSGNSNSNSAQAQTQAGAGFPSTPRINNLPTPNFTDPLFASNLDMVDSNTFNPFNASFDNPMDSFHFSTPQGQNVSIPPSMAWEITGNGSGLGGLGQVGELGSMSTGLTPGATDEMTWSSIIEDFTSVDDAGGSGKGMGWDGLKG